MIKKLLFSLLFLLLFSTLIKAQAYTETFEGITGTGKPTTFTSNGRSFTVITNTPGGAAGGLFGVYLPFETWTMPAPGSTVVTNGPGGLGVGTTCSSGICTGTSDKFLDNGSSSGTGQAYSIKSSDGRLFSIKNVAVFISTDHGVTNTASGNITINGKRGGDVIYTISKTSGFAGDRTINNGFNYINFITDGPVDCSYIPVDEIEFIIGGSTINYFALDNFTWNPFYISALPVQLSSFSGNYKKNTVTLSWQTTNEINTHHYELQWSNDAVNWETINTQPAMGTAVNNYAYTHATLHDINFYRLNIISNNGNSALSKTIRINKDAVGAIILYPNPVKDIMNIVLPVNEPASAQFYNSTGQVIRSVALINKVTPINIRSFLNGVYIVKIIQGEKTWQSRIKKQ